MKRILLSCAVLALFTLPAAASAREQAQAKPGYLVVRHAAGDGGVASHAIVTLVVHGFVLGRVSPQREARIEIYPLGDASAPQTAPPNVTTTAVRWKKGPKGHAYSGNGFRFRALDGYYRVVVRGSGVYLFAGGVGSVKLHGSSFDRKGDGSYSVDGRAFRSLPTRPLTRRFGRG